MNSSLQKTIRLMAALVGLVGLSSCGGGGSDGPAEQSIALFSPIADQRFTTVPLPLTALSTSGLAVAFSSTTAAVCTVTGNTVTLLSVGTCTVAANQSGNPSFSPAPTVTRSFAVTQADQVISFVSPGTQVFGVAPSALLAVSTSGLPVAIVSSTPTVCTVTGTTLGLLDLGNCTLTAVQTGNSTYRAAVPVVQTFAVNTRGQAQTISFASPGTQVLNVPPGPLVATASSNLPVTFTSTTPNVCGVVGTTLSLLTSGSCTVAASQPGNQNFAAAPAMLNTFTVSGRAQTITFTSPGDQTLLVQPAALVGTATSGLAVSFASTTPAVCKVNGTVLTLEGVVGACSVSASQDGNGMFAPATPVVRQFNVLRAEQVITFAGLGNQTLGTAAPALSASSNRGLAVAFDSATQSVCTVSGTAVTLRTTGTCTITATQAGNAVVAAAVPVPRSFQVAAAPLSPQAIAFNPPGNQTLGTAVPALVANASSGLAVSFASSTRSVCEVNGAVVSLLAAGDCTITASQAGNTTTAAATPVVQTFPVARTPQLITFNSPGSQTLGTAVPALVATASSTLTVAFESTTPLVCRINGNGTAVTLVIAGNCTVVASQAGNATYAAAPVVSHTFPVSTAPLTAQTITFAGPGNQTFGVGPLALVATTTASLPVSFATTSSGVCMVSGTTLTIQAAGPCTVTASQSGNSTVAAATPVSIVVTVARASQSITFNPPGDQTMGTSPTLTATASSGLGVTLTSTSAGCSISGNTLTLASAGSCTITAAQGGNGNYNAATPVPQTFNVLRAAQFITFNSPGDQTIGTAAPPLVASSSSSLTVLLTSNTPSVCTVTGTGTTLTLVSAGNCEIAANQPGNAIFAQATQVVRLFTVNPAPAASQTIAFAGPGEQELGVPAPPLSATASSGLAVTTFTSSTPTVCTATGTALDLLASGTCSITASQGGNSSFLPATQSVTFTVLNRNLFANAGFETAQATILGDPVVVAPDPTKAQGWIPAGLHGYNRSADARTGSSSALVAQLTLDSNAVVLQNSKATAGLPNLVVNESLTLRFWVKASVAEAVTFYNFSYALRFLNDNGNILAQGPVVNFAPQTNNTTWSLITSAPLVVPTGATSAFVEFSAAGGARLAAYRIDDVSLRAPTPPPPARPQR